MLEPMQEDLDPGQVALLKVIFEPFDQTGEWPFWQYVDLTFGDRYELDAATVLASLPRVGSDGGAGLRYGLVRRQDPQLSPQVGVEIALTAAGMLHVPAAAPLLEAFLATLRHMIGQQQTLIPRPRQVVEAMVTNAAIAEELLTASIKGHSPPPTDMTMRQLRVLVGHEPFLWPGVRQPDPEREEWTVTVPAVLRDFWSVTSISQYVDEVVAQVTPPPPPLVPVFLGPLDIPNAVGYLNAVWKNRTGSHLFVNLDPASVARLSQQVDSEDEFNSLMSALADVLGHVVVPGRAVPLQRGALESVRDYVVGLLEPEAGARVLAAVDTLVRLRRIRASTQHGDARHRAVAAAPEIGADPRRRGRGQHAHADGQVGAHVRGIPGPVCPPVG